jgi:hypothetical protein
MAFSIDILREYLAYDPETGELRWRKRPSNRVKVGDVAGTVNALGYVQIALQGNLMLVHRVVWAFMIGVWPKHEIDHVNGDPGDNRWLNLRSATRAQNQANKKMRSDNTSGFKGVTFHKGAGKWMSRIQHNGRYHYCGLHDTPEKAHEAYMSKAKTLFGEFATDGRR